MSKISQAKKEAKKEAKAAGKELKGKQKRIAEATAKKEDSPAGPKQKTAISGIPNIGKCCTCINYPGKIHGVIQPCKKTGSYVPRKCEACPVNSYKCKLDV